MGSGDVPRTRAMAVRRRSVQLGPAGIVRLTEAIDQQHRRRSNAQRMTRESRSRLLGDLSPATVDKLLQGKSVDRATAELAFAAVDLKLIDADLGSENDPSPSVELLPTLAALDQADDAGQTPPAQSNPGATDRSRHNWALLVPLATAAMILVGLLVQLEMGAAWRSGPKLYDRASWAGTWRCRKLSVGTQSTPCPGRITHDGITTPCTVQTWVLNADGTCVIEGVQGKWRAANGYFTLILKGIPHDFFVSRSDRSFTLRYDVAWHHWSEYYTYVIEG